MRKYPVIMALFILGLMIVPQWASAAQETTVTEIINLTPESNDCDEVVNVANTTIEYNIDSWDPLPEGIFVGGTIKESLLRLHEVGVGVDNHLSLSTVVRFSPSYLSTGASSLVVRLPVYIDPDNLPKDVNLTVYKIEAISDYEAGIIPAGYDSIVASVSNIADIYVHGINSSYPIWSDVSKSSWLSNNRLYVALNAPIFTNELYVFNVGVRYAIGQPFDIYFTPDDLASDNITKSGVFYGWLTNPVEFYSGGQEVDVDLGFSFVFQVGIGGGAVRVEKYVKHDSYMSFFKWVRIDPSVIYHIGPLALFNASFSFIMEFEEDFDSELDLRSSVYEMEPDVETPTIRREIIDPSYWIRVGLRNAIILGDNQTRIYAPTTINGEYWVLFWFNFRFLTDEKIDIVMAFNEDEPLCRQNPQNTSNCIRFSDYPLPGPLISAPNMTEYFFSSYSTVIMSDENSLNYSGLSTPVSRSDFISGIGVWFSEHWLDILVGSIVFGPLGGLYYTYLCDVGGIFGAAAFGGIVGVLIYELMPSIRQIVGTVGNMINGLFRMIIDGLIVLGTWLWKIGEAIWSAITWFVDVLVDTGSALLAILIYALAVIIPIIIIFFTTKMMMVFLKMAKGNLEGAVAEVREVISTAREAVGK